MSAATVIIDTGVMALGCGLVVEAIAIAAIASDRFRHDALYRFGFINPLGLQGIGCYAFYVGVGLIALGKCF